MWQINRRGLFRGGLATGLSSASAAAIDYMRYRVAAHASNPAVANLDEVYNEWIRG